MKKPIFYFWGLTNQNNGIILLDIDLMVVVAQLVGAPGCGPGGRRFKSGLPPQFLFLRPSSPLIRAFFIFTQNPL